MLYVDNRYCIVYSLIYNHSFYLGPNKNTDFDSKIQRLIDMGIECDQARGALSTYNWDLERATEQLFS